MLFPGSRGGAKPRTLAGSNPTFPPTRRATGRCGIGPTKELRIWRRVWAKSQSPAAIRILLPESDVLTQKFHRRVRSTNSSRDCALVAAAFADSTEVTPGLP